MARTLAVIDDDQEIRSLLTEYLELNGFNVQTYENGTSFLQQGLTGCDLVVLDIGLPDIDGFEVCKRIRERSDIPIVMLTAASDDVDRILGLELGADDYMGKPFNPRELLARIKVNLRRSGAEAPAGPAGSLSLNVDTRAACWEGRPIALTGAEYETLRILLEQPGQVVTRDQISLELKGHSVGVYDRSIDTSVSRLRGKLREVAGVDLIRAVRGKGYVLTQ